MMAQEMKCEEKETPPLAYFYVRVIPMEKPAFGRRLQLSQQNLFFKILAASLNDAHCRVLKLFPEAMVFLTRK
jgi:hypothetical protein